MSVREAVAASQAVFDGKGYLILPMSTSLAVASGNPFPLFRSPQIYILESHSSSCRPPGRPVYEWISSGHPVSETSSCRRPDGGGSGQSHIQTMVDLWSPRMHAWSRVWTRKIRRPPSIGRCRETTPPPWSRHVHVARQKEREAGQDILRLFLLSSASLSPGKVVPGRPG